MRLFVIISLLSLAVSASSHAEQMQSSLYINSNVYKLHGHLVSPYQEHWFDQAALFVPAAKQILQEKYPNLSLCQSGETANRVIKLTPDVFYNPQFRVLHGKVTANVYSGGGTLLGVYVGKSQQPSSIDVAIDRNIEKAYAAALLDLVKNLGLSPQAYEVASEVKLPCNVVGAQEEPQRGLN